MGPGMSDGAQDADKRKFPRGAIELKVEYKRLNTFFADYTKNISKGGTFIKTRKPLDVGTEFLFRLHVPSLDEPLTLRGRVQWLVRDGEEAPGEHPGMGIRFVYDDGKEQAEIHAKVEKLMIDSLGYHLYSKLMREHEGGEA